MEIATGLALRVLYLQADRVQRGNRRPPLLLAIDCSDILVGVVQQLAPTAPGIDRLTYPGDHWPPLLTAGGLLSAGVALRYHHRRILVPARNRSGRYMYIKNAHHS